MDDKEEKDQDKAPQLSKAASQLVAMGLMRNRVQAQAEEAPVVHPAEAWEIGDVIYNQDQYKIAKAVLRRLKRAAKNIKEWEHVLKNAECQKTVKKAMQGFKDAHQIK